MEDTMLLNTVIQAKGKARNGSGWTITLEAKLPGSRYETVLYGQEWEQVEGWNAGDPADVMIQRGNLKQDKNPEYATSYFWDLVSIAPAASGSSTAAVAARPQQSGSPPQRAASGGPPAEYPGGEEEAKHGASPFEEPQPLPVALGAAQRQAMDLIQLGICPIPEGRDPVNFLWETRDRVYRGSTQRPYIANPHWCYAHNMLRQHSTSGAWGHLMEDAEPCVEGKATPPEPNEIPF